jgi:peptidoglycan-associated lipoprotein
MLKRMTIALLVGLVFITMVGLIGCSTAGKKVTVTIPGGGAGARAGQTPTVTPRSGQGGAGAASQISTIYFDYDKFFIREDQMSVMNRNAELTYRNSLRVRIEGHCDERGTDEYNMALGQRRADQLRDFLTNYGVTAGNIETISYGEMRPAVQGSDESAWSRNRRAETVITSGTIR